MSFPKLLEDESVNRLGRCSTHWNYMHDDDGLPLPLEPMMDHLLPAPVADLFSGYLRNRSHIPPLHMDRETLRLLPLHPPRTRIEQVTSRLGLECTDINVRHNILHQRSSTTAYHTALALP